MTANRQVKVEQKSALGRTNRQERPSDGGNEGEKGITKRKRENGQERNGESNLSGEIA